MLEDIDKVVGAVAANWDLLIEKEKHWEIVFNQGSVGSGKSKRRLKVKKVKWLGIIVDDTLDSTTFRRLDLQRHDNSLDPSAA